jgi:D-inositol-3-phosphate glycosyltransferase
MNIGVISYHTSPLAPAGAGKSGGMNVLIMNLYKYIALMCQKSCRVDIFVYGNKKNCNIKDNIRVVYIDQSKFRDFADAVIAFHHLNKYDVLHTHYWLSGIIGIYIRQCINIPWVHTYHTIERFKGYVKNKSRIEVEDEISRKCDAVISPTEKESFELKKIHPYIKTITLPHGIDLTAFRPSPDGHSDLLFVGRVDPIKGLDILIDAMRKIKHGVKLTIIGGPSKGEKNLEDIKAYAHNLRISFLGRVAHKDLSPYYQNAGIVIVPSYYESFGLVGLEAMASARPVIGFNDTGLAETIGSDAGLLVPRNATTLANAIIKLLHDPNLRYQMGFNGRKKVLAYEWRRIAKEYIATYEQITK